MARRKAIFITGAGSGIGQATARHFAAKWAPGFLRQRAKKLMQVLEGQDNSATHA